MGILNREKKRLQVEILESTAQGARAYARKLEAALEVLLDFDAKGVDDIEDFKRSLEATGTPCCWVITIHGYQCLMGIDGELLASNILNKEAC